MNWDQIEGNWKQLKGKAVEKWGEISDDEMDVIAGIMMTTFAMLMMVNGLAWVGMGEVVSR